MISKSLLCAHQTQLANQEHSNQTWPEAQGHIVISSLYSVEAVTIYYAFHSDGFTVLEFS